MMKTNKQARIELFGHPVCAVIRWMGANGASLGQAFHALNRVGCTVGVKVSLITVRAQLLAGQRGTRGAPAVLTKTQAAKLNRDGRW
jgi:hypothetical protein